MYETGSLVISGAKATYTGTGTVNGVAGYSFRVVAIDGQINGSGGFDKFRIKIWKDQPSNVIYDNQPGKADDAADATLLGGGSIVIHNPKK